MSSRNENEFMALIRRKSTLRDRLEESLRPQSWSELIKDLGIKFFLLTGCALFAVLIVTVLPPRISQTLGEKGFYFLWITTLVLFLVVVAMFIVSVFKLCHKLYRQYFPTEKRK